MPTTNATTRSTHKSERFLLSDLKSLGCIYNGFHLSDGYLTGRCNLLIYKVHGPYLTKKEISEPLKYKHGLSENKSSQIVWPALELDVVGSRWWILDGPMQPPPLQRQWSFCGLQWDTGTPRTRARSVWPEIQSGIMNCWELDASGIRSRIILPHQRLELKLGY